MKNFFIKWPKGLKLLAYQWTHLQEPDLIRSSFNPELYMDYLHAIRKQPENLKSKK